MPFSRTINVWVRDEAGWLHPAPGLSGPAGQGRVVDGCRSECAWERSGGCLACGRAMAVVVEERVGRRWKRGRPFSRAARSFHQPPQLAVSATAPPALPELTPDRAACRAAGAVSLCSTPPFTPFADAHIRSGPPPLTMPRVARTPARVVTPRPVSVQDLGRFCGLTFRFLTSVHKMGPFHGLNPPRDVKKAGSGMQGKPAPPPPGGQERRLRLGRDAGNSTQKVLLPARPLPVKLQRTFEGAVVGA